MNYTEAEKEQINAKHKIQKQIADLLSCYELQFGHKIRNVSVDRDTFDKHDMYVIIDSYKEL